MSTAKTIYQALMGKPALAEKVESPIQAVCSDMAKKMGQRIENPGTYRLKVRSLEDNGTALSPATRVSGSGAVMINLLLVEVDSVGNETKRTVWVSIPLKARTDDMQSFEKRQRSCMQRSLPILTALSGISDLPQEPEEVVETLGINTSAHRLRKTVLAVLDFPKERMTFSKDKLEDTLQSAGTLSFLRGILPTNKVKGKEFVALNPTRQDKHLGSFRYNLENHRWKDFSCDDGGVGLISIYAYVNKKEWIEAGMELATKYGLLEKQAVGKSYPAQLQIITIPPVK